MPKTAAELSVKEARFVTEYLVDGNATRAATVAGYSEKTAYRIGYGLLQKPHIKAALRKALAEQEKRTLITADQVLRRIDRVAQKAEGLGDFAAANAANRMLGQHYKLFTDQLEIKDTTPRAERLGAARARRKAAEA